MIKTAACKYHEGKWYFYSKIIGFEYVTQHTQSIFSSFDEKKNENKNKIPTERCGIFLFVKAPQIHQCINISTIWLNDENIL